MQRLQHANVIDVIYAKYPCVEKYINDANCVMCTTSQAVDFILQSPIWKQHIEAANTPILKSIKERYKKSLQTFGFILPDTITYIAEFEKIGIKLASGKPLTAKYEMMLVELAKGLGIKVVGRPKKKTHSRDLYNAIQQQIFEKGFKVSATSVLFFDKEVREEFRNFLGIYLQNTCYISSEDISKNENLKEMLSLESGLVGGSKAGLMNDPNMSGGYIIGLVWDNLAQAFPELYRDSQGKKVEYTDFSVPLSSLHWKDRPIFPKYAQIFILRKEDYLVTNFISAKTGLAKEDFDVYGQLVCTSRLTRSTGMGKLILLATILMAYQYKVNYVFIQAFLGVTHVQAPLYNRLGFNFNFSEKILRRKTGFFQWSLINEHPEEEGDPDLDIEYEKYLKGEYKTDMKQLKLEHLTFLQPMWLYVRGYETKYACDILLRSGFDYHTKSTGSMGQTIKGKIWDLPLRLLGVNAQDDRMETDEIIPTPEANMRRKDDEDCKVDEDCLSDFCVANKCKPYPYNITKTSYVMKRLDDDLREAGFDIKQEKYLYELRKQAEQDLIDKAEKLHVKQEEIERIRKEQDALKGWYEILLLKKKSGENVEAEKERFDRRLEEYKQLTENERYAYIAKTLLSAGWDSIYNGLFGR